MGNFERFISREIEGVTFYDENNTKIGEIRIRGMFHRQEDHSPEAASLSLAKPSGPASRRIIEQLMSLGFTPTFAPGTSKQQQTSLKSLAEFLTKNSEKEHIRWGDNKVSAGSPEFKKHLTQYAHDSFKLRAEFKSDTQTST